MSSSVVIVVSAVGIVLSSYSSLLSWGGHRGTQERTRGSLKTAAKALHLAFEVKGLLLEVCGLALGSAFRELQVVLRCKLNQTEMSALSLHTPLYDDTYKFVHLLAHGFDLALVRMNFLLQTCTLTLHLCQRLVGRAMNARTVLRGLIELACELLNPRLQTA